jgi:N-acetylmuramoyl-L-alanine amidase
MSKYKHLLIAGHGGLNPEGVYVTCPNWKADEPKTWHKMHVHNGVPVFEGVCNRQIVEKIASLLEKEGISYKILTPGYEDVSLAERCARVNIEQATYHNCVTHCIHGNAYNTKAKGFEIFTSPGETKADPMSTMSTEVYNAFNEEFPEFTWRADCSDGDPDKERRLYMLVHTTTPTMLPEIGFFDNEDDAKIFATPEGQWRVAKAYVKAIKRIEQML